MNVRPTTRRTAGAVLCATVALVIACGGAGGTGKAEAESDAPSGYRVRAQLGEGGRVACAKIFHDCGALDAEGEWTQGPGCRGDAMARPPTLECDGTTFYVMPGGTAKPLPDDYRPPKHPSGQTGRLVVQDKSIAEKNGHGEYEYGYVLLNERLEVVKEYDRKVRRIFGFREGKAEFLLADGMTRGYITLDGELVVRDNGTAKAEGDAPSGYRVDALLEEGGKVACTGMNDCGSLNVQGDWTQGPGCDSDTYVRPPTLTCNGTRFYVLPDGSPRPLPDKYLRTRVPLNKTGRLVVQEKSIAEKNDRGEYEYGYVLLNERLEVVAKYGRKVRRVWAFKDGKAAVDLADGETRGYITLDGELVVEGE